MRKGVAGLLGLCLTGGLLAWIPSPRANARVGVIDKELLGVRLLQSYKRVLQLYGQPTRIYRNGEVVQFISATDASGKETGGVKGLGESTDAGGGGGAPGGGFPGSGGPSSGGMGSPGVLPPPSGGSSGRSSAGGAPGPGGFPASGGPSEGGGGPLGGAGGANEKPPTFAESGGFIWVYFYPHDELAYEFIFNTDGRCMDIWERGRYKGLPSERGIRLGDSASKVYSTYGWPDSVEQQSSNLALNYNIRHHAQISLLNGKVVGIAVFLREGEMFTVVRSGAGAGAGGGAPRGGGGRIPPAGKGGNGRAAASAD